MLLIHQLDGLWSPDVTALDDALAEELLAMRQEFAAARKAAGCGV